jgi:hypothetical protein
MSYGIKYYSEFDSFKTLQSYILNIYQKDYTGGSTELLLSGSPVVQEWQEDDPIAPIKGSTLKISYISDGISLDDFYSNEDNTFLVELKRIETGETMFKGYILQDDCQEIQVDFNHIIQLTASDNLGLLKDVTLDQAAYNYGDEYNIPNGPSSPGGNIIYFYSVPNLEMYPGTVIKIYNAGILYYTFTVVKVVGWTPMLGWAIQIVETAPVIIIGSMDYVRWKVAMDINGFHSLTYYLRLCMLSTSLELSSRVVTELYPVDGNVGRWLEDTYVYGTTFLNNDKWMSCYDILEAIMTRFNATCFQSNGTWWIVRWLEMWRYILGTSMTGWTYNSDFGVITSITENQRDFPFYDGSDIETGLLKSITRPYEYSKETFNYVQPENLLCNSNIQTLGPLITSYDIGLYTRYEYELPCWFNGAYAPYPSRYIRITINNDPTSKDYLKEIERIIVISGASGDNRTSAKSEDIQISEGDIIEFSFSYKTDTSQAGVVTSIFNATIWDGSTLLHLRDNGSWTVASGYSFSVLAGDNTNQFHNVTIKSLPIPYTGILNIYLGQENGSNSETHYNDLNFIINYKINNSQLIIGQTHNDSQAVVIKNNSDIEVLMDDVPHLSIKGAMYLNTYTGLVQDLTKLWNYTGGATNYPYLGQLTTKEKLFWRWKPTSKFSGTFLNLLNSYGNIFSMFAIVTMGGGDKRYVPGSLAIDYKNGTADCTLWEVTDFTVTYSDFEEANLYLFNYLYEKS